MTRDADSMLAVARTLLAAIALSVTAIAVHYMPFQPAPLSYQERMDTSAPAPR